MRVDRFFHPSFLSLIEDKVLVNKISKVLRKREGDELLLFNGKGQEAKARILSVSKKSIELTELQIIKDTTQSDVQLIVAFAQIKSAKADILLQKCVELGVDEFYPFISEHTIAKEPREAKVLHFNKVITEACAQSRRLWLPKLNNTKSFKEIYSAIDEYDMAILAEPYNAVGVALMRPMIEKLNKGRILLLIGPEGGFSNTELEQFKKHEKVTPVKFSNNILRAETAAIVLTGIVADIVGNK